jgi:putative addiction module CopG family antidote
MDLSLTPAPEEWVRRKVVSSLYDNASEVIRDALRLNGRAGNRQSPVLSLGDSALGT